MKIGYIGLGKMGINMAERLTQAGHEIVAWNRSEEPRHEATERGVKTVGMMEELVSSLEAPRIIWLMISHTAVDALLETLLPQLEKGDTLVDGGNSYFKDTIRRGALCAEHGVQFIDAGVSGGPGGAKDGACIMAGGEDDVFKKLEPIFKDASAPDAYSHVGNKIGAGHFVKMVHNGIEYGMMQALAEGFAVMKESDFNLDLTEVTRIYNNKSVIESRLVGWLEKGYKTYGEDLADISGTVAHTGEGEWTVKTAEELGVPTPIIKGAFDFRVESARKPSYTGKVLSTLRNMFGGHAAK
jgi:6-phosphogluconate dehydrogenase